MLRPVTGGRCPPPPRDRSHHGRRLRAGLPDAPPGPGRRGRDHGRPDAGARGAGGCRPDPPAARARRAGPRPVRAVRLERAPRGLRALVLHQSAGVPVGHRDAPPHAPPGNGRPRHRGRGRRGARHHRGGIPRYVGGPAGDARLAGRTLDPDLLVGAPAHPRVRRHPALVSDHGRRRVAAAGAPGGGARLRRRRVRRPADAVQHARRPPAGLHDDGPRQGAARLGGGPAPRLPERALAGVDAGRAPVRPAAGRDRGRGSRVRSARARQAGDRRHPLQGLLAGPGGRAPSRAHLCAHQPPDRRLLRLARPRVRYA